MAAIVNGYGTGRSIGSRRRSLDGGGYSGQAASALAGHNVTGTTSGAVSNSASSRTVTAGQKPELSVFDGYFQQQQPRRFEQTGTW